MSKRGARAWMTLAARAGEAALTLLAIGTLSFLLMRFAPGSPFDAERPLPAPVRASLEARYGLDQPLARQYWDTLKAFATLDLGTSLLHPERGPLTESLRAPARRSLELGVWGFALALAFGLLLALAERLAPRPWERGLIRVLSQVGLVLPVIALGPLLIELFALRLGWLPPGGFEGAASRVLPAACLGLVYGAVFFRLFSGGLADTAARPWPLLLQALGVRRRRVLVAHELPASLGPFVSYLGPALSSLLTGRHPDRRAGLRAGAGGAQPAGRAAARPRGPKGAPWRGVGSRGRARPGPPWAWSPWAWRRRASSAASRAFRPRSSTGSSCRPPRGPGTCRSITPATTGWGRASPWSTPTTTGAWTPPTYASRPPPSASSSSWRRAPTRTTTGA